MTPGRAFPKSLKFLLNQFGVRGQAEISADTAEGQTTVQTTAEAAALGKSFSIESVSIFHPESLALSEYRTTEPGGKRKSWIVSNTEIVFRRESAGGARQATIAISPEQKSKLVSPLGLTYWLHQSGERLVSKAENIFVLSQERVVEVRVKLRDSENGTLKVEIESEDTDDAVLAAFNDQRVTVFLDKETYLIREIKAQLGFLPALSLKRVD